MIIKEENNIETDTSLDKDIEYIKKTYTEAYIQNLQADWKKYFANISELKRQEALDYLSAYTPEKKDQKDKAAELGESIVKNSIVKQIIAHIQGLFTETQYNLHLLESEGTCFTSQQKQTLTDAFNYFLYSHDNIQIYNNILNKILIEGYAYLTCELEDDAASVTRPTFVVEQSPLGYFMDYKATLPTKSDGEFCGREKYYSDQVIYGTWNYKVPRSGDTRVKGETKVLEFWVKQRIKIPGTPSNKKPSYKNVIFYMVYCDKKLIHIHRSWFEELPIILCARTDLRCNTWGGNTEGSNYNKFASFGRGAMQMPNLEDADPIISGDLLSLIRDIDQMLTKLSKYNKQGYYPGLMISQSFIPLEDDGGHEGVGKGMSQFDRLGRIFQDGGIHTFINAEYQVPDQTNGGKAEQVFQPMIIPPTPFDQGALQALDQKMQMLYAGFGYVYGPQTINGDVVDQSSGIALRTKIQQSYTTVLIYYRIIQNVITSVGKIIKHALPYIVGDKEYQVNNKVKINKEQLKLLKQCNLKIVATPSEKVLNAARMQEIKEIINLRPELGQFFNKDIILSSNLPNKTEFWRKISPILEDEALEKHAAGEINDDEFYEAKTKEEEHDMQKQDQRYIRAEKVKINLEVYRARMLGKLQNELEVHRQKLLNGGGGSGEASEDVKAIERVEMKSIETKTAVDIGELKVKNDKVEIEKRKMQLEFDKFEHQKKMDIASKNKVI